MPSNYQPNTVTELKAVRESDMGLFLDAGTGNTDDDILLHKAQQTDTVKIGDRVKVFLYLDPKRRLTASMRVPKMRIGQVARLKVINVSKDGAFLDAGAERGIFMPFAGMRGKLQIGETVWAKLYTDKSGRLAVTMEVEDKLRRAAKPAENVKVGDRVCGAIYNLTDSGAFMFSEERYIVFIARKEMPKVPKIGATVAARVTFVRKDGRLNASLRPPKEKAMTADAKMIYDFLCARGGRMPYCDKTAPEIINAKFNISKAAFKRALGHLLKAGMIEEQDGCTVKKI